MLLRLSENGHPSKRSALLLPFMSVHTWFLIAPLTNVYGSFRQNLSVSIICTRYTLRHRETWLAPFCRQNISLRLPGFAILSKRRTEKEAE
jgi:hypothetical protein